MKQFVMGILLAIVSSSAYAHEMVPTYPTLVPSHLDGIVKTTVQMFNKREDVEYYEIGVFDENFKPIPFVTSYSIIKIEYLGKATIDVYIRRKDIEKATYICSQSKLRKDDTSRTAVSSMICSKFRK